MVLLCVCVACQRSPGMWHVWLLLQYETDRAVMFLCYPWYLCLLNKYFTSMALALLGMHTLEWTCEWTVKGSVYLIQKKIFFHSYFVTLTSVCPCFDISVITVQKGWVGFSLLCSQCLSAHVTLSHSLNTLKTFVFVTSAESSPS